METSEPVQRDSIWTRPGVRGAARWIGLVLFIGISWLYLASGLLAPMWAVGVLWVLWLALLVALIKVWRSHPWLVLATPVLAYLIWAGVLLLGEFFLGWSA
jgi:hypothetical protein